MLFTASDTENSKPVVVYMSEKYGTYYVRSLKEFTSNVNIDEDVEIPRFALIPEKQ